MTPLEELQAAHKRLSELRNTAAPTPWSIGAHNPAPGWEATVTVACADGGEVTDHIYPEDADLIVTLHRTIDAQFAVIDAAITRMHVYGETSSRPEVLSLARAINGDHHDHPDEAHDQRAINGGAS